LAHVHAERQTLIDDLRSLDQRAWDSASLCQGWSVRDVFGHITATARMTPPAFAAAMAKAGFRFNRMNDNNIARETAGTTQEQIAFPRSNLLIGGKSRVAAVTLTATGTDWAQGRVQK